jgi:hypothetical protein
MNRDCYSRRDIINSLIKIFDGDKKKTFYVLCHLLGFKSDRAGEILFRHGYGLSDMEYSCILLYVKSDRLKEKIRYLCGQLKKYDSLCTNLGLGIDFKSDKFVYLLDEESDQKSIDSGYQGE